MSTTNECTECEKKLTGMKLMDGRYLPHQVEFCSWACMEEYWPKTIFGQAALSTKCSGCKQELDESKGEPHQDNRFTKWCTLCWGARVRNRLSKLRGM